MRYALFGQAEGIRCASSAPLWASVRDDSVTDASLSARSKGVCPGMSQATAQAFVPGLELCSEHHEPTPAMHALWRTLYAVSPWLETVGLDSFYLEIPGQSPPLREIRDVLHHVDGLWTTEQRVRVGLAESPFLARALVAWSQLGRVPGALYRKAGRQQLIISPGVSAFKHATVHPDWFTELPINALWILPQTERERLLALGVRRFVDLQAIPFKVLRRHFGKQADLWLAELTEHPGGRVHINYPPPVRRECWLADAGEDAPAHQAAQILVPLVSRLAAGLTRMGTGALKIGVSWETEHQTEQVVRIMKQPVSRQDAMLAQLQPALAAATGYIRKLEVFAEDIRPANAQQMSFTIHRNWLVPMQACTQGEVESVIRQLNRKYPKKLQIGLRPSFRDMRLQAVLDTADTAPRYPVVPHLLLHD